MPLTWETVAVPVTDGINTNDRARLLPASELLEAVNSRLSQGGSEKRFGHSASRVRYGSYLPGIPEFEPVKPQLTAYGQKILSSSWVYGYGYITSEDDGGFSEFGGYFDGGYPEAGQLVGGAARDFETVAWNGHRLYTQTPGSGEFVGFGATMPALKTTPIAKSSGSSQQYADLADSGKFKVVVWYDSSVSDVKYSILDSATGATVARELSTGLDGPPRVVSLGSWFHIFATSAGTGNLHGISFNQYAYTSTTSRSFGTCTEFWDMWKIDETACAILVNQGPTVTNGMILYYIGITGAAASGYPSGSTVISGTKAYECSVSIHPTTKRPCIGWISISDDAVHAYVRGSVFNGDGTAHGTIHSLVELTAGQKTKKNRVSCAARYLTRGSEEVVQLYASLTDNTDVYTYAFEYKVTGSFQEVDGFNLTLASHAFRVGQKTFIWAANISTLQSLWVLLDAYLRPVGSVNFSTANVPSLTEKAHLPNVNWHATDYADIPKDRLVFEMALGYRVRVPTASDQVGLFTEGSIEDVRLDFLPRLRAAQAGRCTYFAGAQLWSYDGAEVVEAGFHVAPEFLLQETAGGALTAAGTYSYRLDLCYRNAQNEEVRSHSLLVQTTLTTGRSIVLTIKPGLTRRENAYILVFRNAMISGAPTTSWNLINSRDPASGDYIPNDQSQLSFTYTDAGAVTDTAGQSREFHPGNNSAYLHPFAAPACEVVVAGADRLWVAGGELGAGEVAPSRLFDAGECPAFNSNINRFVDRGEEPITALGFVGGVTMVFRPESAYILDGDGPDNYANGYWTAARLALAETGAVSQESLALTSEGLIFQSKAGFRMLGPGGALTVIGKNIDMLARHVTFEARGAVVCSKTKEARFYGKDITLVYNYVEKAWSTWTCTAAGAILNKLTGLAILFSDFGSVWTEEEGLYLDAESPYEHKVRFAWLHGGALGDFMRVRRILGLGEWDGTPHSVRVEMFYDERADLEEYWEWDVPDTSQNNDAWGDNTWGAGSWGDTHTVGPEEAHDSVWRWRRRPRRQKCSVFSVSVSDKFSPNRGFVLTVLGLELGRKTGLDRAPVAGGTGTYRG